MGAGLNGFEKLDSNVARNEKFDISGKIESFNKSFKSSIEDVKGSFGQIEQSMGDSISKAIGRNEVGNAVKNYFDGENKLVKTVELIEDGITKTTSYDGKGTAYLEEITDTVKNTTELKLKPDIEIIKENFVAKTDNFGRTISCKVDDVQVKASSREILSEKLKDATYRPKDERGHIIADILGGPATKENVVPQDFKVNRSQMKQVENIVRKLKEDGHKVDYEVKVNYVADEQRPSSFEPTIKYDDKVYELPNDLKKIYNESDSSAVKKVVVDIGEKHGLSNKVGVEQGAFTATVTCAMSTVDNVSACINGEITADEAAINIAKETAAAGAVGYSAGFITNEVATAMSASTNSLISSLGNSCIPAAAVSFGISSYDTVVDYAKGEIGADELAYDLGENAVGVAGAIGGSTLAGAAIGSIVPGAGTVVGAGAGLVGGMVGYAVTSGAYETVVQKAGDVIEAHADELEQLQNKAESIAHNTINMAAEFGDAAVSEVKAAITDFNIKNALPFKV